jgi:hypothetical protein
LKVFQECSVTLPGQPLHLVFFDDWNIQLFRFIELGSGVAARHDVVGLLAYRSGDPAAGVFDQFFGFVS